MAQTPSTRRAATAWKASDTGIKLGHHGRLTHGRQGRDGRRRVVRQIGDFGADLGRRDLCGIKFQAPDAIDAMLSP